MNTPDVSESEWTVMEELWKRSPQTASDVAKALRRSTGWAQNTVRTLLTRLLEKGAVRAEANASGVREFAPAVEREACVRAESESFLERVFQGAAKPLLVHFASNAKLTPEEVRELKRLFDQSLKNQS
jgi:BlaI family penicillinase repressor